MPSLIYCTPNIVKLLVIYYSIIKICYIFHTSMSFIHLNNIFRNSITCISYKTSSRLLQLIQIVDLNFKWAIAKHRDQCITPRTSLRADTALLIHIHLFIHSFSHQWTEEYMQWHIHFMTCLGAYSVGRQMIDEPSRRVSKDALGNCNRGTYLNQRLRETPSEALESV